MSKTILYVRVSTTEQTSDHQLEQARKAGFQVDDVVTDHGTSGVTTKLAEREGGKRLFDMLREGDTLVVRWVDRLGRNYQDVTDTIREFINRGVTIKTVINNMVFDGKTTDPTQKAIRDALIGFMAAMAEAQAEANKETQRAGIAHHKATSPEKFKGRKPNFDRASFDAVQAMLNAGQGHSVIAKATGVNRNAVIRIAQDPAKAEAALVKWGM
ncbi:MULTISPECIES: recombinase family protein [unclassified Ruegeria]|uniref:recombinase family protein n=1 Tax=unclassified Ruegeria TaxID=2625375 RepID=UPI0014920E78|nr:MULTISPECIES: recombinase family protein [unclassified Ruegeria]NOD90127.1 recombinase family protein [Ruegeria sp. HKCCD4318]NOE15200.1 recombinase family protein [Ruegeria sp. HKCCD4318-2]NOG10589.1 recombinase family protein [Ruegeria sp. HKCCD4315]